MDKTETYVKMSDHELIQSQWIPEEGDFYVPFGKDYIKGYGPVDVVSGVRSIREEKRRAYLTGKIYERLVWLPRQDQIQKMLGGFLWISGIMIDWFTGKRSAGWPVESFEQVWLHLYMGEKHNRIWDGEKWIAQK